MRPLLRMCTLLCLAIAPLRAGAPVPAKSPPPPIPPEAVAALLKFKGKLEYRDRTAQSNRQGRMTNVQIYEDGKPVPIDPSKQKPYEGDQVFWSGSYTSPENDAAIIGLLVAPSDSPLITKRLEMCAAQYQHIQEKAEATEEMKRISRKIKLPGGTEGYTALLGFGPGGAGFIAIVTDPKHQLTMAATVVIPGDPPPTKESAVTQEAYWKTLNGGEEDNPTLGAELLLRHFAPELRKLKK